MKNTNLMVEMSQYQFCKPLSAPKSAKLALFGQQLWREPGETKSWGNLYVCTSVRLSVRPSVPPGAPQRLAKASQGQVQTSQSRSSQFSASL